MNIDTAEAYATWEISSETKEAIKFNQNQSKSTGIESTWLLQHAMSAQTSSLNSDALLFTNATSEQQKPTEKGRSSLNPSRLVLKSASKNLDTTQNKFFERTPIFTLAKSISSSYLKEHSEPGDSSLLQDKIPLLTHNFRKTVVLQKFSQLEITNAQLHITKSANMKGISFYTTNTKISNIKVSRHSDLLSPFISILQYSLPLFERSTDNSRRSDLASATLHSNNSTVSTATIKGIYPSSSDIGNKPVQSTSKNISTISTETIFHSRSVISAERWYLPSSSITSLHKTYFYKTRTLVTRKSESTDNQLFSIKLHSTRHKHTKIESHSTEKKQSQHQIKTKESFANYPDNTTENYTFQRSMQTTIENPQTLHISDNTYSFTPCWISYYTYQTPIELQASANKQLYSSSPNSPYLNSDAVPVTSSEMELSSFLHDTQIRHFLTHGVTESNALKEHNRQESYSSKFTIAKFKKSFHVSSSRYTSVSVSPTVIDGHADGFIINRRRRNVQDAESDESAESKPSPDIPLVPGRSQQPTNEPSEIMTTNTLVNGFRSVLTSVLTLCVVTASSITSPVSTKSLSSQISLSKESLQRNALGSYNDDDIGYSMKKTSGATITSNIYPTPLHLQQLTSIEQLMSVNVDNQVSHGTEVLIPPSFLTASKTSNTEHSPSNEHLPHSRLNSIKPIHIDGIDNLENSNFSAFSTIAMGFLPAYESGVSMYVNSSMLDESMMGEGGHITSMTTSNLLFPPMKMETADKNVRSTILLSTEISKSIAVLTLHSSFPPSIQYLKSLSFDDRSYRGTEMLHSLPNFSIVSESTRYKHSLSDGIPTPSSETIFSSTQVTDIGTPEHSGFSDVNTHSRVYRSSYERKVKMNENVSVAVSMTQYIKSGMVSQYVSLKPHSESRYSWKSIPTMRLNKSASNNIDQSPVTVVTSFFTHSYKLATFGNDSDDKSHENNIFIITSDMGNSDSPILSSILKAATISNLPQSTAVNKAASFISGSQSYVSVSTSSQNKIFNFFSKSYSMKTDENMFNTIQLQTSFIVGTDTVGKSYENNIYIITSDIENSDSPILPSIFKAATTSNLQKSTVVSKAASFISVSTSVQNRIFSLFSKSYSIRTDENMFNTTQLQTSLIASEGFTLMSLIASVGNSNPSKSFPKESFGLLTVKEQPSSSKPWNESFAFSSTLLGTKGTTRQLSSRARYNLNSLESGLLLDTSSYVNLPTSAKSNDSKSTHLPNILLLDSHMPPSEIHETSEHLPTTSPLEHESIFSIKDTFIESSTSFYTVVYKKSIFLPQKYSATISISKLKYATTAAAVNIVTPTIFNEGTFTLVSSECDSCNISYSTRDEIHPSIYSRVHLTADMKSPQSNSIRLHKSVAVNAVATESKATTSTPQKQTFSQTFSTTSNPQIWPGKILSNQIDSSSTPSHINSTVLDISESINFRELVKFSTTEYPSFYKTSNTNGNLGNYRHTSKRDNQFVSDIRQYTRHDSKTFTASSVLPKDLSPQTDMRNNPISSFKILSGTRQFLISYSLSRRLFHSELTATGNDFPHQISSTAHYTPVSSIFLHSGLALKLSSSNGLSEIKRTNFITPRDTLMTISSVIRVKSAPENIQKSDLMNSKRSASNKITVNKSILAKSIIITPQNQLFSSRKSPHFTSSSFTHLIQLSPTHSSFFETSQSTIGILSSHSSFQPYQDEQSSKIASSYGKANSHLSQYGAIPALSMSSFGSKQIELMKSSIVVLPTPAGVYGLAYVPLQVPLEKNVSKKSYKQNLESKITATYNLLRKKRKKRAVSVAENKALVRRAVLAIKKVFL